MLFSRLPFELRNDIYELAEELVITIFMISAVQSWLK